MLKIIHFGNLLESNLAKKVWKKLYSEFVLIVQTTNVYWQITLFICSWICEGWSHWASREICQPDQLGQRSTLAIFWSEISVISSAFKKFFKCLWRKYAAVFGRKTCFSSKNGLGNHLTTSSSSNGNQNLAARDEWLVSKNL